MISDPPCRSLETPCHLPQECVCSLQVSGFPTIMFVSGKDGSISSYEGSREQDDLIKFINDHSTRSSSVGSSSKDEL